MRILIATGIYPPDIGGPAKYAKNLKDVWEASGHKVTVKIFGKFQKIPWGFRHIIYFFYIIPSIYKADCIFTLDAFNSGVFLIVAKLFSKKVIFRTGGDAIWELYVERTGDKVLLREFYKTNLTKLNFKEKIMFYLMRWTLQNLSAIIWSTDWQKNIFMEPYKLQRQKHFTVENYYGPKEGDAPSDLRSHTFVASARDLKWKNVATLKHVFNKKETKIPKDVDLLTTAIEPGAFADTIKNCYAVILVSLGDISPNTIMDAIRYNRPFICTKEVGIYERIKDLGIFVDPLNEEEIEKAVLNLLDPNEYEKAKNKVKQFSFTHTWEEIAGEFIEVYKSIK